MPPDRLGDYLRDFRKLLDRYDYSDAAVYGHFGQGCVHTRIPFDLRTAAGHRALPQLRRRRGPPGRELRRIAVGRARRRPVPRASCCRSCSATDVIEAFEQTKSLFDPQDRMNPGKVVRPYRITENLRLGTGYLPIEPKTAFAFPEDGHRFSQAANRCVGVGKCRGEDGGVMCPSYRATGEEEHSTRGRARLLFEMLQGDVITDGWRSTDVRDALDLCLACKGCLSDCPVNVDMATYKAEFLHHHYRRRLRPMAHYSMGWIPLFARLASTMPATVNAVAHARGAVDGAEEDRWHRRAARGAAVRRATVQPVVCIGAPVRPAPAPRGKVLLWPDTFTNNFDPDIARDAVTVLEAAGFEVEVPRADRVLRPDLDLDRAAQRGQGGAASHPARPGAGAAAGHPGGRPGTQLRRGLPRRSGEPARRRRGRAPAGPPDLHDRRSAERQGAGLEAPRAPRARDGATALSSARRVEVHPGEGPARGRRGRRRCPRRRMLWPGG